MNLTECIIGSSLAMTMCSESANSCHQLCERVYLYCPSAPILASTNFRQSNFIIGIYILQYPRFGRNNLSFDFQHNKSSRWQYNKIGPLVSDNQTIFKIAKESLTSYIPTIIVLITFVYLPLPLPTSLSRKYWNMFKICYFSWYNWFRITLQCTFLYELMTNNP